MNGCVLMGEKEMGVWFVTLLKYSMDLDWKVSVLVFCLRLENCDKVSSWGKPVLPDLERDTSSRWRSASYERWNGWCDIVRKTSENSLAYLRFTGFHG